MTVIEITKSTADDNKQHKASEGETASKSDRAVGGDFPSNTQPFKKSVSFVPAKMITPVEVKYIEAQCVERARELLEPCFDQEKYLRILRKLWDRKSRKVEEIVNDVLNSYYEEPKDSEEEELPVQTCAERPAQAESGDLPNPSITYPGPILSASTQTAAEREKNDIDRAIENSLREGERPPGELRGENSVGIENIGQTCWFSAAAQILFHIPEYRKLLYELTPEDWGEKTLQRPASELDERDLLARVREMFAHMDAGNHKFVDPKAVLEVAAVLYSKKKDAQPPLVGKQQDAPELLHSISDWLEKGLMYAEQERRAATIANNCRVSGPLEVQPVTEQSVSTDSMECSPAISAREEEQMIVDDPSSGDHVFVVPQNPHPPVGNLEKNSVVKLWKDSPLKDIWHCSMVTRRRFEHPDCEPNRVSTSQPLINLNVSNCDRLNDAIENHFSTGGGAQSWYETLPNVIFIALNRYLYEEGGGVKKLHIAFEVPPKIFMDRHLDRNRELVHHLTDRRRELRNQLAIVNAKLKGFTHFPLGEQESAPLSAILDSTRQFISGEAVHFNHPGSDRVLPAPLHIGDQLRADFLGLLEEYRKRVAKERNDLAAEQARLQQQLDNLFEREDLKKEEYTLNAIVIHEGEALMGHYWSCIRGDPRGPNPDSWQKFNDRKVEFIPWAQVEKEAHGSLRSGTSAYALVYVRTGQEQLYSDAAEPVPDRLERLPADLAVIVAEKNEELLNEIQKIEANLMEVPEIRITKAGKWIYDPEYLANPIHFPRPDTYIQARLPELVKDVNELKSLIKYGMRSEYSFDHEWDQNLTMLAAVQLRIHLHRLNPRLKEQDNVDKAVAHLNMTQQDLEELYERSIVEWPTVTPQTMPPRDVRVDVLSFWRSTGIGMHSILFRLFITKCYEIYRVKFLELLAKKELENLPTQMDYGESSWFFFHMTYTRIMCLFTLLKQLWALTKCVLIECKRAPKLDQNTSNDYLHTWTNALYRGHQAVRIYETIRKDLEKQAAQDNTYIDPTVCIMDFTIIRGAVIYSFLKLYKFLLLVIMRADDEPNEVENLLHPEHPFNVMCQALNTISGWSHYDNFPLATTVVNSVTETLTVIEQLLPISTFTPAAAVVISNLRHAADPTARVSTAMKWTTVVVQLMEAEINEVINLRLEVGLTDLEDASETMGRLIDEATADLTRVLA